ncbi:MAG: mechanosensitive ion channel domain-containing protein [Bacteroidales bacterium]|jgi:miniconductance mechanosensitive channel|nr:mechanosensitive ion channel domain-containing protein [Bacteroidales bacterium]
MVDRLNSIIAGWFTDMGVNPENAIILREIFWVIVIISLAIVSFYVTRYFIIKAVHVLVARSKTRWDDILAEKRVFVKLAYLAPAITINFLTSYVLTDFDFLNRIIQIVASVYIVIIILGVVNAFLNAFNEIYNSYEVSREKPIKGYIQVAKIFAYIIAVVIIITVLIGKNSFGWVAGFGAFSAVLMLIFKDPILGFVGGIQLTANNMVRIGDWIEMPKYGADGTVIDISLTTVKVQNWNKTITTIPTYTLVTDYFKNWRGMDESGGRRIKRSINLDMNSVTFCTPEMLERFKKYEHVSAYVAETEKVLTEYNKNRNIDNEILVNGRRQTNIGVFRAYLKGYLRNHPKINSEMTFLVRQLDPTPEGIPMEVYIFSKDKEWAKYEDIQSDIFDHILAVVPEFDLRVFQQPTGRDFSQLNKNDRS